MTFGAPLGLLALAAVPLLVGLYLLRRRQPPRRVSALFLWRGPDWQASAGPRLERFSREVSLLAEIGAALAAAAFLADAGCGPPANEPHSVLVLDASLSMSATLLSGRRVADLALEQARRAADSDGGRVTVVLSGPRPRVALGPAAPRSALDAFEFRPGGPDHDLGPALALARELAGPGARIRLYTDAPLEPAPDAVAVVALGEPLANTAFVAAARRDADGRALVLLRVAHFGPGSAEVPVLLESEQGARLHEERLSIEEGAERGLRAELAWTGPIVARLPDDALPEDGRALLLPNPARPLKVALNLPAGAAASALRALLAADGAVDEAAPPDLVFAEPGGPAAPWTLLLGAAGEPRALTGPFFADRNHRLLDGAPLEGLLWVAGDAPPGLPLLTAAERVLVSESPGPVFHLNLLLERSNLHRTAAWPVLLANLLALRREALTGFARPSLALGEELRVNLSPGPGWSLEGPGPAQPLRGSGAVRLPPPSAPGRYRLLADGVARDETVVLALDRAESDLRRRGPGRSPSSAPLARVGGEAEARSPLPLALMAGLLLLDWLLVAGWWPRRRQAGGFR